MEGYIIKSVDGKNLTKNMFWYEHSEDFDEYPYVFSEKEIKHIRQISNNWQTKPAYLQKASYSEKDGVKITGNLERFWVDSE
jgi:hypothetical protein